MAKHILQPRDAVMLSSVTADVVQKSTDSGNFGKPLEFSQYNCVAFQAWWNGLDGSGIFQLQVSVKMNPSETDWVDKPGAFIETVGASGTNVVVASDIGEKSLRVKWIPDGNTTGTISTELIGKDSSGPANYTPDNPLQVTASFTGLRIAGRITEVTLSNLIWTPLPTVPLVNRNALSIQNISGTNIKIGYDPTEADYFGVQVASGIERFYDITDSIVIYAKAESGSPKIIVEELS